MGWEECELHTSYNYAVFFLIPLIPHSVAVAGWFHTIQTVALASGSYWQQMLYRWFVLHGEGCEIHTNDSGAEESRE